MPEVFPPHYTFSTKILLNHINTINLEDKTFLELGCGCGIISLFAASKGAKVTASDINAIALKTLEKNALNSSLKLQIIDSDLFKNIDSQSFDYIIINPPYYPKTPKNVKEQAWFCGENFEYFQKLFKQLSNRKDKIILMILSQDCNIEKIKDIASIYNLHLKTELEQTTFAERNYIFKIYRDD